MSGSFTGFSEEDIRKLNNKNPSTHRKPPVTGDDKPKIKTATKRASNDNHHQNHNSELRSKVLNEKINNFPLEPIIESAKLNKTIESPSRSQKGTAQRSDDKIEIITNSNVCDAITGSEQTESSNIKDIVLIPERKLDLDELQARQKLIEEQNRKKKELLMKALAAKTKQTQEETQRLNEVREEFKKLDALLSNDVRILRKQIEVASLEYMEAQKKYFKIEREFLDSKLYLHHKLEKKEMLTEHLCTIIEKNEERKSQKLNELLLKLNLKTESECVEQIDSDVKPDTGGTNDIKETNGDLTNAE